MQSFLPPSFSKLGLAWPPPAPDQHAVPIRSDELLEFADWAVPRIRELLGERTLILVQTGASLHDRQIELVSRRDHLAHAAVQVIGRTPAQISGWSGRTRSEGEELLLPFHVTGTGAAFFWISRVEHSDGSYTTGFHARYATKHPERDELMERDADITLADWCKATGHEPDLSS